MNSLALIGGLAGGVGLFLLGMWLMTDGLKLAAGPALERILVSFTRTRLRGLALEALGQEVRHMGSMAIAAVKAAFNDSREPSLARRRTTVTRLAKTIADFIVRLNRAGMSQHQSERLSQILRQVRYYEAAAELAAESVASHAEANRAQHEDLPETARFTAAAKVLLSLCEQAVADGEEVALHEALQDAEQAYQALKARLLELGLEGRLPVPVMDAQLRNASVLRRALDQVSKASRIMP